MISAAHEKRQSDVYQSIKPLSKELSGVILPREHYGSHLDSQDDTFDKKKEL